MENQQNQQKNTQDEMISLAQKQIKEVKELKKNKSPELFKIFDQQMEKCLNKMNSIYETVVQVLTFEVIFGVYPSQIQNKSKQAKRFIQQHEKNVQIDLNDQFFAYQRALRSHFSRQMSTFKIRQKPDSVKDQKLKEFFNKNIDFDFKGTAHQNIEDIKHYENFIEEYIQFMIDYGEKPAEKKKKNETNISKQNKSIKLGIKVRAVRKNFFKTKSKLDQLYPKEKKKLEEIKLFFDNIGSFSFCKKNLKNEEKTKIISQIVEKQKAKLQKGKLTPSSQENDEDSESGYSESGYSESGYSKDSEEESEKEEKPEDENEPDDENIFFDDESEEEQYSESEYEEQQMQEQMQEQIQEQFILGDSPDIAQNEQYFPQFPDISEFYPPFN